MSRKPEPLDCITLLPGVQAGQACVGKSRLRAEVLATYWLTGMTLEYIERNWPGATRRSVLLACWYQARYGTRSWRTKLKPWLDLAASDLWYGRYDTCPLPEQKK